MSEWREDVKAIRTLGFWKWAFYRTGLYRVTMRALHRFSLHYAPISQPIQPGGTRQRWCQWCGMRDRVR